MVIDAVDIEDGKIRFAIDTGRLFIDTRSERIEITDVVKGLKYSEIVALESPLPKVYLSSDSHQILMYDYAAEDWIVYGGGGIAPSFYVIDMYYNDDGDTVLIYGDGTEKVIPGGSVERIASLEERTAILEQQIADLEEIVDKFNNAIDITKLDNNNL